MWVVFFQYTFYQIFQSGFINRNWPILKLLYFIYVNINTCYIDTLSAKHAPVTNRHNLIPQQQFHKLVVYKYLVYRLCKDNINKLNRQQVSTSGLRLRFAVCCLRLQVSGFPVFLEWDLIPHTAHRTPGYMNFGVILWDLKNIISLQPIFHSK